MIQKFQIAIDGPVASGKSTVAKLLADKLRFLYIDTGAMYRGLAYKAKDKKIDWSNEIAITSLVKDFNINLKKPSGDKKDGRTVTVLLNNKDVSWDIRTQEIAEGASVVSQYKKVRQVLVKKQQQLAAGQNVVMEGRDIGTVVLPKANLKIFMTADVDKRIRWKQAQMKAHGHDIALSEVKSALLKRDKREMNRKVDPLRPATNAWMLDTSHLTIDQIVDNIIAKVKRSKTQ